MVMDSKLPPVGADYVRRQYDGTRRAGVKFKRSMDLDGRWELMVSCTY